MSFSDAQVDAIWKKARVVPNNDPAKWRKDACDAWIGRDFYGNRDSEYGWEIDHIKPVAQGGGDDLSNLQPLQHQNNSSKAAGRLDCEVTANDIHNVPVGRT
jgi:HNH endonuclease